MKAAVTKWFPFNVQPLYKGWYEVKLQAGYTRLYYWDRGWFTDRLKTIMNKYAVLWRGLKEVLEKNYVPRKTVMKPKVTPPPVVKALTLWQRIKYQIWS